MQCFCEHYIHIEDDVHTVIRSDCNGINYDNPIPIKRKVKTCTRFSAKGVADLNTMYTQAVLIDVKGKPNEGFMSGDRNWNKRNGKVGF